MFLYKTHLILPCDDYVGHIFENYVCLYQIHVRNEVHVLYMYHYAIQLQNKNCFLWLVML